MNLNIAGKIAALMEADKLLTTDGHRWNTDFLKPMGLASL